MKTAFKTALLATAVVCAGVPAHAATSFTDVLGATGVTNYRFSFGGGSLQINVDSQGTNPIGDPSQYVFVDDGSPDTALTGTLLGYNDDFNGLNSQQTLNLAAGNYILSVGRFQFLESEARSFDASGYFAGTSYRVTFNQDVAINNAAVPEPSAWALMILGFGLVGASMRQRKTRLAYA